MKSYIIKKGRHYSNHLPKLWFGDKNTLSFKVKMGCSCWFSKKDPDDSAINKLVGWSYGFHHKNSIRIGWTPAERNNWIELYLYIYVKGVRLTYYLDMIECNVTNKIEVTYYPKKGRITYTLERSIAIVNGAMTAEPKKTWWGYYLFPYFGGKKTAPVDTKIDLSFE